MLVVIQSTASTARNGASLCISIHTVILTYELDMWLAMAEAHKVIDLQTRVGRSSDAALEDLSEAADDG